MKKISLCPLLILLVATSVIAFATPCGTTTLNNMIGTACSIGSLTFKFTGYYTAGYGYIPNPTVPAKDIVFGVDAANPLAPSFTLTSGDFKIQSNSRNVEAAGDPPELDAYEGGMHDVSYCSCWTTASFSFLHAGLGR